MNQVEFDTELKKVENMAEEFVARTMELCEKQVGSSARPLTRPQAALSAAAMGVQQSVEIFIAVGEIENREDK